MSGAILVISGPSGAGKSSIISRASKEIGDYYFSISSTTRPPREGEVDGVNYHFISKDEFEEDIDKGNFLEYARVHGNYYGTSMKAVKEALSEGKLVIFDIDVQGHAMIRQRIHHIVTSVFITPPTIDALKTRLHSRNSDDDAIIEKRVKNSKDEVESICDYDFVIINDDLNKAVDEFISIAKASKLKYKSEVLEKFIKQWKNL